MIRSTRAGALARVGKQLGINSETLRNWVTQAEIDGGVRPGTTTDDAARIAKLERENRLFAVPGERSRSGGCSRCRPGGAGQQNTSAVVGRVAVAAAGALDRDCPDRRTAPP